MENTIVTVIATMSGGSQVTLFPLTPSTIVTPTDVEVDLVLSDGTTKKFVPAA